MAPSTLSPSFSEELFQEVLKRKTRAMLLTILKATAYFLSLSGLVATDALFQAYAQLGPNCVFIKNLK